MGLRQFRRFATLFWLDLLFGIFWGGILIGTFQLFYEGWTVGFIKHPIKGTLIPFLPHHMYLLEMALLAMWIMARRHELALRYEIFRGFRKF